MKPKKILLLTACAMLTLLTACGSQPGSGADYSADSGAGHSTNTGADFSADIDIDPSTYPEGTQSDGNWSYSYDPEIGGIVIEECLCLPDYYHGPEKKDNDIDLVIPDTFEEFKGAKVLKIGTNAFRLLACNSLTLPESLEYIDPDAFAMFFMKGSLKLPEGLKAENIIEEAFENLYCETVIIPSSWDAIPDGTFYGLGAKKVIIPENITVIGERAFMGCRLDELMYPDDTKLTLHDGIEVIGQDAFTGFMTDNLVLPANIKNCYRAFNYGINVESVTYDGRTYNLKDFNEALEFEALPICAEPSETTAP